MQACRCLGELEGAIVGLRKGRADEMEKDVENGCSVRERRYGMYPV